MQNPKERPKPKTVRSADYNCAYVTKLAVLIIFPVILQTVINLRMLSTGGQGQLEIEITLLSN